MNREFGPEGNIPPGAMDEDVSPEGQRRRDASRRTEAERILGVVRALTGHKKQELSPGAERVKNILEQEPPVMNDNSETTPERSAEQSGTVVNEQGTWRRVTENEVLPAGSEVSLNLETGESFLKIEGSQPQEVPGQEVVSVEVDIPGETEWRAEVSPEQEAAAMNDMETGVKEAVENGPEKNEQASQVWEYFRETFDRFRNGLADLNQAQQNEQGPQAQEKARTLVDELRDWLEKFYDKKVDSWFETYDTQISKVNKEKDQTKKQRLLQIAIEGIDFIPVIGSVKMIGEGLEGRTMNNRELTGWNRVLHTAEGAAFLALDATGLGVLGRGAKAGKLLTRSAAVLRYAGFPAKLAKPVYRVGSFIARTPMAEKAASKVLESIIAQRDRRKIRTIKRIPEVIFDEELAAA